MKIFTVSGDCDNCETTHKLKKDFSFWGVNLGITAREELKCSNCGTYFDIKTPAGFLGLSFLILMILKIAFLMVGAFIVVLILIGIRR